MPLLDVACAAVPRRWSGALPEARRCRPRARGCIACVIGLLVVGGCDAKGRAPDKDASCAAVEGKPHAHELRPQDGAPETMQWITTACVERARAEPGPRVLFCCAVGGP